MTSRRAIIATAVLVASGVLFGSATATAAVKPPDQNATTTADATLIPGTRANLTADRAATAYWTADRMSRALALPEPTGGAAKAIPLTARGPAGTTAAAAATAPAARTATPKAAGVQAGGVQALAINESAVVGRVFFHVPNGGDASCSATALNSASKQLVVTAGHCVHQGAGGGYMQNWIFVPRYRNGSAPFGQFAAKQFRVFNSWTTSSDLQRDVAMVTTYPLNGNKLVNVVGGDGLAWNQSRNVAVTILGYPSNFASGESQYACQGTTYDGGGYTNAINCNFGPGSSGSGWVMNFDNSNGLGAVNGAMSTLSGGGVNRASYFDDAVKAMFDAQGSVT